MADGLMALISPPISSQTAASISVNQTATARHIREGATGEIARDHQAPEAVVEIARDAAASVFCFAARWPGSLMA